MSFRRRIAIASATAVAIAVVLASILIYVLTSSQLHEQVNDQLLGRANERTQLLHRLDVNGEGGRRAHRYRERLRLTEAALEAHAPAVPSPTPGQGARSHSRAGLNGGTLFSGLSPTPAQVRGYQQVVNSSGKIIERSSGVGGVSLPVEARTRALAAGGGTPFLRDAVVDGIHMRILAEPLGRGHAVQFAQQLTEVDNLLSRLRLILALVVIGGIALAALLGRLVAGAAVLPLKRLTAATEHVAETQDLSQRMEPTGADEIGRLAGSFNAMLDALERSMRALDASVDAQRQLVADASHELRTPVTSLRTNIEILQQQGDAMEPAERQSVYGEVVEQIGQLTLLMNDLIDLARGEGEHAEVEDVRLDVLAQEVIERTRRQTPRAVVHQHLDPTIVSGVPARLQRAVANLIDNAIKYSPPDEPVEVSLQDCELTVRDRGPGIAADEVAHVFDRFYRGAQARGRPGSGLGLAIVRQVATEHGGSVSAEPAPGGGTLMRLRLPGTDMAVLEDGDEPAASVHEHLSGGEELGARV